MAISSNSISGHTQVDYQTIRKTGSEQKIREASLDGSATLTSDQIRENQKFYNKTLKDIDGIRKGDTCGCNKLDPSKWDDWFGNKNDKDVRDATNPRIRDNKKADEVRSEYRKAYNEAKRERARAERLAKKLGPGEHTLSNGDKVTVKKDPCGKTTITTKKPDGTIKTVSFDPKKKDSVDVKTVRSDGSKSELHQDGSSISKSETDKCGKTTRESFSLDDKKRPVKESFGPDQEDYTKITVNNDGSTDTQDEVYEDSEDGTVFHNTHEPPGWTCPGKIDLLPRPWWREPKPEILPLRTSISGVQERT